MRRQITLAAVLACALVAPAASAQSPEALRAYQTANGLLAKGHHDLAIPEYEAFLRAAPDHEQADTARYGLAVCLHRNGQFARARDTLAEITPNSDFRFADESALLSADCALRLNEPDASARTLRTALRAATGDSARRMRALLVEAEHRASNHERAIDAAEDALRADPTNRRVRALAGRSCLALGDEARALRFLTPLAESDTDDALKQSAMLSCAQARHRQGDAEAALELYAALLAKPNPELLVPAMLGAAQLSREAGDLDRAASLLDRLGTFTLDTPTTNTARYELGLVRLAQERYDEAVASFARVGNGPLTHNATFWTAKALLRSGDAQRAASVLKDALKNEPEGELTPEMRYELGVALARSGKAEASASAFEAFLREHPRHALAPGALHALAAARLNASDARGAIEACDAFRRIAPDHPKAPDVAFIRAEALHLAGNTREAFRATEDFLRTYPDHERAVDAKFRRGLALHDAGRSRDARADLTAAAASGNPKHAPAHLALAQIEEADEQWVAAAERYDAYAQLTMDPSARHDAQLRAALALNRAGDQEKAIARLSALDRDTTSGRPLRDRALFELGQIRLAQNDDARAKSAFEALLARGPADDLAPHVHRHLGDLAMRAGNSADASQYFNSAGIDGADASNLTLRRARAALASGDAKDARDLAERLLREKPDADTERRARATLVLALSRLGEHTRVLTELRRIEAPDALDEPERRALELAGANALRHTGDVRSATSVYRRLVNERASDAVGAHAAVELAALLIDAGDTDAADALLAAIDTDQAPALAARATYLRAATAHRAGDMSTVATLLDGFQQRFANDALLPRAALLRGDALLALGRAAEAARALRAASDESAGDAVRAPALLRLGEANAALQDWPASRAAYETRLNAFPDDPLALDARFGLARALEHQGEYDPAIAAYRAVADGHAGALAAHAMFQIGECLFAQNEHEEAVREFLRIGILFDAPEWASAGLYEAGRCFEMLNRTGEARAQYTEVLDVYPTSAWAVPARERLDALASRSRLPGRTPTAN